MIRPVQMKQSLEFRQISPGVFPSAIILCIFVASACIRIRTGVQWSGRLSDALGLIFDGLVITVVVWNLASDLRRCCRIEWDDQSIDVYHRKPGRDFVKWDRIQSIREDQVSIHLFYDNDQVVVKKKAAPSDLLARLSTLSERRNSRTDERS